MGDLNAQALYWSARVLLIFGGKLEQALECAGKARFFFERLGDKLMQAEVLLVLAQIYHKLDKDSKWASNAAHDALDAFSELKNTAGKDRTFELFQELGIALKVAGGGGVAAIAAGPAQGSGGSATEASPAAS